MRHFATALLCLVLLGAVAQAQPTPDWRYERAITFPESQRALVRPYQVTVTDDGAVWVLSSSSTDPAAHNAVWRAAPGATEFSLFQDYTSEQIGIIFTTRGITSFGNTVLVSSHYEPPSPFGSIHVYPNGDRAAFRTFNTEAGNAGYGTYVFAVAATRGGMVYATISARPSIRLYDFRTPSAPGYGNWVAMEPFFNEEQAGHDGCSRSALRDLAVFPNADYATAAPAFFTSRNGSPQPLPDGCNATVSGRVSVWSGSTQAAPQSYANTPLISPGGEVDISPFVASGIAADADGRLWVTGPDSTRRWVKAFDVSAPLAFPAFELPSATAEGAGTPDPAGAPFAAPVDVALTRDNALAYVADRNARAVFVFRDQLRVSSEGAARAAGLRVFAAVPNPFRGRAALRFELASASDARVTVVDVLGRHVATLVDGPLGAGVHTAALDGAGLAPGVYAVRVEALGQQVVRTLVRTR